MHLAPLFAVTLAFALVTGVFLLSLWALGATGVPVRASDDAAVQAALELLALRDGESFADLGCGDGRVLRAARARADVAATGFELNPWAWLAARLRADRRTRIAYRDFRRADLGAYDAVYAYLMPGPMPALAEQLRRQGRPGVRLVSIDFAIPDWEPVAVREVGPLRQPVRLYRVPAATGPGGAVS